MYFPYDCIIIGGGPAGLVSALYLKRFWRSVLVIDKGSSRAAPIPKIHNLAGYVTGISGAEFLKRLRRQLDQYEVTILKGEGQVFKKGKGFQVKVGRKSYLTKKVIIATGVKDNQPPVKNYLSLCKRGLLAYCPVCDGYNHSNQDIGLLIDSANSFRRVRFVSTFTKRLHVVMLKKIIWPPATLKHLQNMGVSFYEGPLESLKPHRSQKKLVIHLKNQEPLTVDMAYVELGCKVPNEALKNLPQLRKSSTGFFITTPHQETSIPGLYAVGDCVAELSQISVAMGNAAIAATHIHNQLLLDLEV